MNQITVCSKEIVKLHILGAIKDLRQFSLCVYGVLHSNVHVVGASNNLLKTVIKVTLLNQH